jgi:hypothetical protein
LAKAKQVPNGYLPNWQWILNKYELPDVHIRTANVRWRTDFGMK